MKGNLNCTLIHLRQWGTCAEQEEGSAFRVPTFITCPMLQMPRELRLSRDTCSPKHSLAKQPS
jgi:hypothetical protein